MEGKMRHRTQGALAALLGVAIATLLASSAHATDSVYWTNTSSPFGSYYTSAAGGASLDTRAYTVKGPSQGLVFDPAAGRAYWSNPNQDTIGYAEIDDGGSGDLPT